MIHQKLWLVNRLKREIIWHFGALGTMEHIVGNGLRAVPVGFDANGAKSTILEFAGYASDSEVPAAERHIGRSLRCEDGKSGATADAIAPPRVTLSRYVQFELKVLTWQPAKRRTER